MARSVPHRAPCARMLKFFVGRLLASFGVLFGVASLTFMLLHLTPGDPVEVMLGETSAQSDRAALREALGLNQPLPVQYVNYLTDTFSADLGASLYSNQPVATLIAERLPYTLSLTVTALVFAVSLALPLGVIAALRRGSSVDAAASMVAVAGLSIPNIWLGPLLIYVFAFALGWVPVAGAEGARSLILPTVTLGTSLAAVLMRMTRASLLEVLHAPYIVAARARGLPARWLLLRYALRNAALPILTVIGLQLGALLGGAVVTEAIFAWPGLGQLLVESIQRRDYPVVQGVVLFVGVAYVLVNMAVDIGYGWLDPRVRLTRASSA